MKLTHPASLQRYPTDRRTAILFLFFFPLAQNDSPPNCTFKQKFHVVGVAYTLVVRTRTMRPLLSTRRLRARQDKSRYSFGCDSPCRTNFTTRAHASTCTAHPSQCRQRYPLELKGTLPCRRIATHRIAERKRKKPHSHVASTASVELSRRRWQNAIFLRRRDCNRQPTQLTLLTPALHAENYSCRSPILAGGTKM